MTLYMLLAKIDRSTRKARPGDSKPSQLPLAPPQIPSQHLRLLISPMLDHPIQHITVHHLNTLPLRINLSHFPSSLSQVQVTKCAARCRCRPTKASAIAKDRVLIVLLCFWYLRAVRHMSDPSLPRWIILAELQPLYQYQFLRDGGGPLPPLMKGPYI